MVNRFDIRDAVPSDAPFLARCILSGMHMSDFDESPTDHISDILAGLTACERRDDTLYTYRNTRIAEVNGVAAGALLSYPGELYADLRERTFREFWPAFFEEFSSDDPETGPGEYYLDSLAVTPEFRRLGVGKVLLQDGIRKGAALGYTKVALVADPEYPHLIRLYESLGFVPAEQRHAFGTDFQRMVFSLRMR